MPASSMEASNLPVGPLYANPTSFVAVKSSPLHPKRKVTEMSLKRSLFDHFFMSMHQLPFRRRSFTVQMHHQIPINPQIVLERPHPHFSFNLPKHSHLRRFPRPSFSHKSFYLPYTEYTEFHRGENFNPCLKTSFNADYADYRRLKSMFFRVIRVIRV